MSGVDVLGVLSNLAAIVRVHEGNRCPLVNRLLDVETPTARAAIAELIEAADGLETEIAALPSHVKPESDIKIHFARKRLRAALAAVRPAPTPKEPA